MDVISIPLPSGLVATISACDAERVLRHKWCATKRCGGTRDKRGGYYVHSRIDGKHVKLHRFIMQPPDDMEVDHDDGNGLNCTRGNMKVVTHLENMHNRRLSTTKTSQFLGVHFHAQRQRWQATIRLPDGRKKYLGLFDDEEAAAAAYKTAASEVMQAVLSESVEV